MRMLKVAGLSFLLIGAVSGAGLVGAPLVPGASAGPSSWILFPLGFAAGSILLVLGSDAGSPVWLWRVCGGLLLVLAVGAGIRLALAALGAVDPAGNTLSLWYVLVVAGPAGAACASVSGRIGPPSAQPDSALRDAPSSR